MQKENNKIGLILRKKPLKYKYIINIHPKEIEK